jgi:capsular exopolysaccharide synthesis family protein
MSEELYDFPAEVDGGGNIKELLFKYLRYWPWFLASLLLCLSIAFFYLRYAPVEYYSEARIKVLKESETMPQIVTATGFAGQQINLENEIEMLKSYRLNRQVVEELNLDIEYYEVGNIKTTLLQEAPFIVEKQVPEEDFLGTQAFMVTMEDTHFLISNARERQWQIPFNTLDSSLIDLPFRIRLSENAAEMKFENNTFKIVLKNIAPAGRQLASRVIAGYEKGGPESIYLGIFGENKDRSEAILNTLIDKFNRDGIQDRQEVYKRTIDFIDDRFVYLSQDLDSIERGKQSFKEINQLVNVEADAGLALQQKTAAENEVARAETQIYLARMLQETLEKHTIDSLLPADVGLENIDLNELIGGYNELILSRQALLPNMGEKNPPLMALSIELEHRRENILSSLEFYEQQMESTLSRLKDQSEEFRGIYAELPEEERLLRAIERQQNLKENVFLVLLQKREEAAINLAITAPSIKVIDYALTGGRPTSPVPLNVYGIAVLSGLFVPFGVLFLIFTLDTKIRARRELEKALPDLPVVAEVPHIPKGDREEDKRSELSESFRILSTNVKFLLRGKRKGAGNVIMITSSVKSEGKTLLAIELARAYSSLHKKVLLVGGDLRNPRLHENFGLNKNDVGFSNYLSDPDLELSQCIQKPDPKNTYLDACLSGPIPPNAPQLLSGQRYREFLEEAREVYDYIILDTAPTVLVTDSMLMDDLSDVVLYLVRSGFTDSKLMEHIKALHKSGKMEHIALVLNDVKQSHSQGYNYGYGYGYGEEEKKTPWYQRILKKSAS